ncbi:MAG: proline dehydrogenase family protein [Flavobacteriaceae bacterium]|nr:proline dehydrogenase family protein [Flavobacteriaceae bacterium]
MVPNFENTAKAFALKSDLELKKAYWLFSLIGQPGLARWGSWLTKIMLEAHLPIEGLIKKTVFHQFCGGISEQDCFPVIENLQSKNVFSVLDYSVEGKADEIAFDHACDRIASVLVSASHHPAIPFGVFKPTGLGPIDLFELKSQGSLLNPVQEQAWQRVVDRFDRLCGLAAENSIPLLIDAEESWMQDSADQLVLEMMRKYNQGTTIVYQTIQAYRWDRKQYAEMLCETGRQEGFKIGVKLVRGAYMEKENQQAAALGIKSPICPTKEATDQNFDEIAQILMSNAEFCAVFLGTHNEESTIKVTQLMEQQGMDKSDSRVWFAQLFGMSDHISFNLSDLGYKVAKYLPFGPVREVMPYLMRRAAENTSVAGQTSRELSLLAAEMRRRKL